MALHLLNVESNEHVNVHEVSGFISDDIHGALNEAYALSKGTKCKKFMYSLSLNPPQDEEVPEEVFINAVNRVEQKLGLEGQPRLVAFHEKEGRRHAHCIWSRIDTGEMKAINIGNDHYKLKSLSKELYIENNWDVPKGIIDFNHKDPFNYTRAEWERAKKTDRTPPEIAEAIRDAWVLSDNKKTFKNALKERGFYLAKGKRGRFVTVDHYGEVYAVTKKIKLKKEQVTKRLGDVNELQSVEETKELISQRLTAQFKAYITELRKKQRRDYAPLQTEKYDMTGLHRQERAKLQTGQEKRWQAEELKRNTRMRSGFKGLWDKLTGSYQRTRRRNETETEKNQLRDNKEKQKLINVQLTHRQKLQGRFQVLRKTHKQERAELFKGMVIPPIKHWS